MKISGPECIDLAAILSEMATGNSFRIAMQFVLYKQ